MFSVWERDGMESLKQGVSAIVIARNEEDRIAECLKSLLFVNERIVVDNGSSDNTISVAEKYKSIIVRSKSKDFSELRSVGWLTATFSWILYIDADERVTPALKTEIQKIMSDFKGKKSPVAYYIFRNNYYLGHGWPYKDMMLRFFYKKSLLGWKGRVHESAEVRGKTAYLKGHLLHFTHRSLSAMVTKTNEWSAIEAELRVTVGHPEVSCWRILRVMVTAFFEYFFRQGGWKAGMVGWVESVYQGFSMFITYAKLWELQQKDRRNNVYE